MNAMPSSATLGTIAIALAFTACTSPGGEAESTAPSPRPSRVVTALGTSTGSGTGARTGALAYTVDEGYESVELPGSAEAAWPALLQVYEDLELGMGTVDTEAYIVGNPQLVVTRRLAGHRLSRLFRCGSTMTGPVADASRITVTVETRLEDIETGAVASTLVQATAVPTDGGGAPRQCTSSGQLEIEIHEALIKLLVLG